MAAIYTERIAAPGLPRFRHDLVPACLDSALSAAAPSGLLSSLPKREETDAMFDSAAVPTRRPLRDSALFRLTLIGVLVLVLLIPLAMIRKLVFERAAREGEAAAEIAGTWGGAQVLDRAGAGRAVPQSRRHRGEGGGEGGPHPDLLPARPARRAGGHRPPAARGEEPRPLRRGGLPRRPRHRGPLPARPIRRPSASRPRTCCGTTLSWRSACPTCAACATRCGCAGGGGRLPSSRAAPRPACGAPACGRRCPV